jgi:hypothetical protein
MTGEKFAVVLKSNTNWYDWIGEVQARAETADIWHYVDPSLPEKPTLPIFYKQVDLKRLTTGMTEAQTEEILNGTDTVEIQKAEFSNSRKEYNRFVCLLKESLTAPLNKQVARLSHPYDIIKELAIQYKLSEFAEAQRIDAEIYKAFERGLQGQNTLHYLIEMTTLWRRAVSG